MITVLKRLCVLLAVTLTYSGTAFSQDWEPYRGLDIRPTQELETFGTWERNKSERRVTLRCTTCTHPTTIQITIRPSYSEVGGFPTPHSKYLIQRKQYCTHLSVNQLGRCLGTKKKHHKGFHMGFVSTSKSTSDVWRYETVLLYEGTAIVGVVEGKEGTQLTNSATQIVENSVLRLTALW